MNDDMGAGGNNRLATAKPVDEKAISVYDLGQGGVGLLEAENAKLRAENAALKAQLHKFMDEYGGAMRERDELKAEVGRLKAVQADIAKYYGNMSEKWKAAEARIRELEDLYNGALDLLKAVGDGKITVTKIVTPPATGESDGEGETK